MFPLQTLKPVDYLVIGHITLDLTTSGPRLGGTASYAGLTARALGLRVGIVTSWGEELGLEALHEIPIISFPTDHSTTFENLLTPDGRLQIVSHVASNLDINLVPDPWLHAPIVHIAPVAQEVEPNILRAFPSALVGITPQGWLRWWDKEGVVSPTEWPEATFVLNQSGATVMSIDDVAGDEARIEEMAASCHVLAVTEGAEGSRVYWNGDVRRFSPSHPVEVDPTGAGDIYAAAFFTRLFDTRDAWEAGRFATQLSAFSVTRRGLEAIPSQDEIQACMVEVF